MVSITVVAPLDVSKIALQLGLGLSGVLTTSQGLLIILKSNFLHLFIVTFKSFFQGLLQGTFFKRISPVLLLLLMYPFMTIRLYLISDFFGIYKSIVECFNFIMEQGVLRFYSGFGYSLIILFISHYFILVVNTRIVGSFWKKTFLEIVYLVVLNLIIHPFYTLMYKSQLNHAISDFRELFGGIWMVPIVIFIEILFKNMFYEIGKSILNVKSSTLPE